MSQTHETDTCEVLVVRNLNVAFRQQDAPEVQAVRQLSFSLRRGQQRGEQRGAVVAAA
ncbi:hypothetical protein SL57_00670 [Klebsiella pneumoniae]|nr:hypothetical protein SL57_00670 [Klebsiella pneumoniae]